MGSENKWTPGPWYVHTHAARCGPDERFYWAVSQEPDEEQPCDYIACSDGDVGLYVEQAIDNAHLIAAAPDLFAELEEAREVIQALIDEGYTGFVGQRECIDRVLSKARGEQP